MAKQVVPEEARRRRRPTRQGTVLSERLIVDTALRMLREHGSTGLSARRLGAALGADPSTLYRYFDGMDGLTLAIGEELIGRALDGWAATGDWRRDLRELGLRIHSAYLAHPQAALLTASRVTGRPREIAADEAVLGILRTAAFPDPEAVLIYHAFIDQSLAFAALDAGALALAESSRTSDEQQWESTYARLPAEQYPHIAATTRLLAARMNHSAYPVALDMLLASAEAGLQAATRRVRGAARRGARGLAAGQTGPMTTKAVLEGGPEDLPERVVPVTAPGEDLKIAHRGGYEHFKATSRFQDGTEGRLPVYEWWERTEIAE